MPAPGTPAPRAAEAVAIRPLRRADLAEVVRIHALHTGTRAPAYWEAVLRRVRREGEALEVALVAPSATGRGLAGFLVGEVRAFEFGSEPCGWVFAVGVDPGEARGGVATALLDEATRRFAAAGVRRVRTMVRRDDVPVLAFFRANGFAGGAFVQLERSLDAEEEGS
ncbi:MAG: GNAT family N-acetyltransferase [Planctomycetes bacterium]|nr:GNAT family N-acetyltransferase [Planctomycetota bacterium]